jgi:CRP-like cAMP-binding protein
MAILNGKARTATATALEITRCLVLEAHTLEQMVAKNSEIAVRLIKKLARRLDAADQLVEVLMHRDPKARLMLALMRHADSFGEPMTDGVRVRMAASDIAREVAVDVSVAVEVMTRLRRLRLAWEDPEGVVVADVGRLREFFEFLEMPLKFGGEA